MIESKPSNARYAIGNNGILTSSNKCIGGSFNNSITIVAAIVDGITTFDYYGSEGGATRESIPSNARYAVGDGDGGEGGAIIESSISYACYAIGDSDRSEGGAI